jgi:uncharacterized protein
VIAAAADFPERSATIVTDYAGVLTPEQRQSLEAKLVAFDDTTSTQIAIVLMRSIGSYDIADYSVQLFNRWKIGDQKKNNGVLLLAAIEDRKVFITTGFGIEGVLPDALCKRIVARDIVPNFKKQDYYSGLDAATTSIIGLVNGEFKAEDFKRKGVPRAGGGFFLMIILFILFILFFTKSRQASRYARMNNLSFWAAWALLNAAANRQRGHWRSFSGGGGFGGGGFGGGGFGGFGGGMSGGGGAGGSW